MKKLILHIAHILIALAIFTSITHINTMMEQTHAPCQINFFDQDKMPKEMLAKIAAHCESVPRAHLSLTNKYLHEHASIDTNREILKNNAFNVEQENRLYYLFYSCLYDLPDLTQKALAHFDLNKQSGYWFCTPIYDDRNLLYEAYHCIKRFPDSNASKLLPQNYSDILVEYIKPPLHFALDNDRKGGYALFFLLLKHKHSSIYVNDIDIDYHLPILDYLVKKAREWGIPAETIYLHMHNLLLEHPSYNKSTH